MFKETLDLIKGMVTFMRSRSNIAGTAIVAASLMSGVSFADYNLANTGSISIAGTGAAANAGATNAATADLLEMKAAGNLTFSTPSNASAAALTSLDMEGNAGVITVGPVAISNIFESPGGDTSKIVLDLNNSVFPTNVFSTTFANGTDTSTTASLATNIHADLSVVTNSTNPLTVPAYVSQLNVTAANTNDITLLAANPTLKLTNTLNPGAANNGLQMNGGTVEVAANTANMVPPVADFDTSIAYAKKKLKFSTTTPNANPLASGVTGLNFTTYSGVFDTIELAHATDFSSQDITLDENQTLEISSTITVPSSGSSKFVTFAASGGTALSAIKPAVKLSGAGVQAVNIPKILKADVGGTVSDVDDGNASLEIGVSLTNALDLSNSTDFDKYGTVILSGSNTTTLSGMPTATANLKITGAFAPSTAATIAATNKVEVTGQSGYLLSGHKLHNLDDDFTVTGGHVIFSHDDADASKNNLKDALASQKLGRAAGEGGTTGTAEFTTLQINDSFEAPASGTPFTLGAGSTLILNNATLLTNIVKFESSASSYPMVKVTNTANGAVGTQGSSLASVILDPVATGNQYDLSIGEGITSSTTDVYFTPPTGAALAHVRKLILSGGSLRSDIGTAANPISQGTIEFNGGTVDSSNKIYAVNSTVELKSAAAVTDGSSSIVAGEIEGYNNTLVLGQNEQLGTFHSTGFGSSSVPFVFSSFSELDTSGGLLLNHSYLKLTKTSTDLALDTLEVSTNYNTGSKIALELNNTDLILGGRTLPAEIDAILVENGHNTSAGGTELNLQMTAGSERNIWNAQFKYTDPTATRVNPTFNGSHNKVLVSGLQPGTEVYKLTGTGSGNKLGFYDVPGDFVIRASGAANNAWTVCTNATCTATAGGSKIFTLTTAEHGVDGYLSFSEESQALLDTRYEFLGSKVASIVNRSSGDNGFTKYGFRSTRAASSKAPKYSAMTSGMSYKTDMSNMVSVAKGVKSTVGIELTHGKVIDAKNLAFGTYVAMDKDLMPTVAVGGVYNMNYETLIRSNIPTGATTIGSHDKDVAHFFTHTANLHATKSDILKFAGHSLGARLNFNALFTPKFVSSGVTYHKNDLYQVVPELTLDMKLGMLGLNGKLTGAYYSYLGDFKQEISITNGANTVTEKYEIDGKTGVFAQLELDKSISKHAKLSVNGTLGEHKLYSLGLALKVEA